MKKKYKCIICGRIFPEGQGIVIKYGDLVLSFHSNRCASKFLRQLLERIPSDEIKGYVKRLVEENLEQLESLAKIKAKKI